MTEPTYDSYNTLIKDITEYVYACDIAEDEEARSVCRLAILDALGCAVETLASRSRPSFIGPWVPGITITKGFRLPGTSYELDPLKGAFDMSVLIRYLDHSDGIIGAEWGHPSDNIGTILALLDCIGRNPSIAAANSPPPTIDTLITGIIKAYEIQGCLQIANAFNAVGLDHVILVKIASTAVACWLLGLSSFSACAAISHAWLDGHPLRTYRHAPNAGPRKGWAGGDACMRAVQLALLVKSGQPGVPTVLDTPGWGFNDALFQGQEVKLARKLGTWAIRHVFFKLVPAEAHALAAMEAILAARAQILSMADHASVDFRLDVKRVRVRTHAGACLIINKTGPLQNAADRDHCMQYILAVSLLKGAPVEYDDYVDASFWAKSADVERLRGTITLTEDEQFTKDYSDQSKRSMASAVSIELNNGTTSTEVIVEFPVGNPKNAGTPEAVQHKYRSNLAKFYPDSTIDDLVESLETPDAKVSDHLIPMLWFGENNASEGREH